VWTLSGKNNKDESLSFLLIQHKWTTRVSH